MSPGRAPGPAGRSGRRKGTDALPRAKRAVLELFRAEAEARWRIRLRVVRRELLVMLPHAPGDPRRGPATYAHLGHAWKAARDIAAELGLDPWEDVVIAER